MVLFVAHPKVLHWHNDRKWNTQAKFRGFGLKHDFFFFFMEQINEGKTCVAQCVLTTPTAALPKHVRLLWNAHPPSLSTIQLLGVSPTTCSSASPTCHTLNLTLRLSACIRRRMAATPSEAVNNTAKWVSERLSRLLVRRKSFRFRQSGPLSGTGY